VARQPGTTLTIKDLFSSLPVRHKQFVKTLKAEYSKMLGVVQSYALVRVKCVLCVLGWSQHSLTLCLSLALPLADLYRCAHHLHQSDQKRLYVRLATAPIATCRVLKCGVWWFVSV
jgi:hypothetical protein